MTYLVDANVLSEATKPAPNSNAIEWLRHNERAIAVIVCVSWDAPTGLRWAKLLAELRKSGKSMPIKDSLIAATALVHDFIVVTRNTHDFRKAQVKVLDPFA